MASLNLNAVSKIYPSGTLALYKTQLSLDDKEFIVVTGAENSGKTTLLRVIAGLEEVTDGDILIDGKRVNDVDPKDRDVAMIFNTNTLYPQLNVFDNMSFGLKLRKFSPAIIERRVKAAAEVFGLTEVLFKKPKQLTTAQKQKVTLARAVVREPRLYLLDDPFSGLDEKLKTEMISVVRNIQARMEGTFIYVTKNVSDALTMATRIVVLKDGFVQQIDSPENLYDYPVNAYVAFFVGNPTINFIRKAVLVEEEGNLFALANGIKIAIGESVKNRIVEGYIGTDKQVIVGIRPEDAKISDEGYNATVNGTESAGGYNFAECQLAKDVYLVVNCDNAQKGEQVKVEINAEKIYLFDEETQLTVLNRDGGYQQTGKQGSDFVPLSLPEEKALKAKYAPLKEDKKKTKK